MIAEELVERFVSAVAASSPTTPGGHMTNAGRWCDRCGIHRVDDPREPFCPSCQDDLHHEEAEARRGLGWEA